jgi:hypothetical protein
MDFENVQYWQLSRIWSWHSSGVGPFSFFLAIGLYGKIPVYFSQSRLTALTRHIPGSFLTVHVDYVPGRQTIFRGSLGRDGNVCSMPSLLSFDYSHLSASRPSPHMCSPCSYLIRYIGTSTGLSRLTPRCRSIACLWW